MLSVLRHAALTPVAGLTLVDLVVIWLLFVLLATAVDTLVLTLRRDDG